MRMLEKRQVPPKNFQRAWDCCKPCNLEENGKPLLLTSEVKSGLLSLN